MKLAEIEKAEKIERTLMIRSLTHSGKTDGMQDMLTAIVTELSAEGFAKATALIEEQRKAAKDALDTYHNHRMGMFGEEDIQDDELDLCRAEQVEARGFGQ